MDKEFLQKRRDAYVRAGSSKFILDIVDGISEDLFTTVSLRATAEEGLAVTRENGDFVKACEWRTILQVLKNLDTAWDREIKGDTE